MALSVVRSRFNGVRTKLPRSSVDLQPFRYGRGASLGLELMSEPQTLGPVRRLADSTRFRNMCWCFRDFRLRLVHKIRG